MGCVQSKKEVTELHPNIFRVVNIDERGADMCSGQLEISDVDIVLYREGREQVVWPLHSLRRYGFEGDIFSFESGRRCETGEGIYAFRCRRAGALFRTLQQQIQQRNVVHDSLPYLAPGTSPSAQGRQTLQASVVHRSSVDNGRTENNNNQDSLPNTTPSRTTITPRSPSSADILEVMPLYPRPSTNSTQVTNVYQVRELKKENNNNQSVTGAEARHLYCNDLSRDLAVLRNTLKQKAAINSMRDFEDEQFLESRFINEGHNRPDQILSPTASNSSEHYAALSVEQQQELDAALRPYMNLAPQIKNIILKDKNEILPDKNAILPDKIAILPDLNKLEPPQTPSTPKAADYCNLNMTLVFKPEVNSYANLSLGELSDAIKTARQGSHAGAQEHSQKFSESDTFTSLSPVEELEVNYAVLDIDGNGKEIPRATRDLMSPESQSFSSSKNESTASCSSNARARLVSQTSLEKPPSVSTSSNGPNIGYTTIDFEKTVALTAVKPRNGNDDCNPKTRHDSDAICPKTP